VALPIVTVSVGGWPVRPSGTVASASTLAETAALAQTERRHLTVVIQLPHRSGEWCGGGSIVREVEQPEPASRTDTGSEPVPSASRGAILIALDINVAIAAVISGSSAVLAEAAHSIADTGNEVFLLVALRSSARHADDTHPFGYGADRFWSLLAVFGIFVAGGLAAVVEGVYQLLHPHHLGSVVVGYVVLADFAGPGTRVVAHGVPAAAHGGAWSRRRPACVHARQQ
jgi:Cation efflux family